MKRNLESRVETMVPVEKPAHQQELQNLLETQLADDRNAWEMRSDGSYEQRSGKGKSKGSQQQFIRRAEKQHKQALRLRKRRPVGVTPDRLTD